MIAFLIKRPVAVLLSLLGMAVFSVMAMRDLPVSLLPPVQVPQIVVKVRAPETSPQEIENTVITPIRENFLSLNQLKDVETRSDSESGSVKLLFEYGTDMNLAYVAVNERIDRLSSSFPDEMPRPRVIKINATDIPVVKIHITPKDQGRFPEVSEFVKNVLKKRIEQLDGVSLVDINGLSENYISIEYDESRLIALRTDAQFINGIISRANQNIGGISVKSGQYRYFVKIKNDLSTVEDLRNLPIRIPDEGTVLLSEIATIKENIVPPQGFHLFQGERSLVLNVHKQASANMIRVLEVIENAVGNFEKDYSFIKIRLSGDQTELLEVSLDNLSASLLYGGIFAFIVLFLFFSDYRLPLIIGISLPLTLLLCFLFFYFFDLTINIISLSGLALGLGMLIDNAIIVVDNITQKRTGGLSLFESVVKGVNEVIPALLSSVLTTLAVFTPLVFLSGIAGVLFRDQAIAVAIILILSLFIAFIFVSLLYYLFFKKRDNITKTDSKAFTAVSESYHWLFVQLTRWKWLFLIAVILFSTASFYLGARLEVEGLPEVERDKQLVEIDWNEPVNIEESKRRMEKFLTTFQDNIQVSDIDMGLRDYLMNQDYYGTGTVSLLINLGQVGAEDFVSEVSKYFETNYPQSDLLFSNAPNAFDQLFKNDQAYLEARISDPINKQLILPEKVLSQPEMGDIAALSGGFSKETLVELQIDRRKLNVYGIRSDQVIGKLQELMGSKIVTELKSYGNNIQLIVSNEDQPLNQMLSGNFVSNAEKESYPLHLFLTTSFSTDFKSIYADKTGRYQSLKAQENISVNEFLTKTHQVAVDNQWQVTFTGNYFSNIKQVEELIYVLIISVLLLYFILAALFESFLQPLIIIVTIPVTIGGALLTLYLFGSTINIMSLIGVIVMIGIIVNDSILKVDTINRLRKEGSPIDQALSDAGMSRLKPILMTSLTTILALLPIVFFEGLGATLQIPLVLAVTGGLTIGTLISIFLIPILYKLIATNRRVR